MRELRLEPEQASITVAATLTEVREIAAFVRRQAALAGLSPEASADLELATVEAANNVVLHACAGAASASIEVRSERERHGLLITLVDFGEPLPASALDPPRQSAALQESGRGLCIIHACADEVSYRREGPANLLSLFKAR